MLPKALDDHTQLRLTKEADAEALAAVTDDVSPEDTRRWVHSLLALHRDGVELPCAITVDGDVAGHALLEIHDNGEGLLHYGLRPAYRGRGLATRACEALVEEAFTALGLSALKIDPAADNAPSCAVAERLGFSRVGRQRIENGADGYTIARYRLTAAEWRAAHPGTPRRRGPGS